MRRKSGGEHVGLRLGLGFASNTVPSAALELSFGSSDGRRLRGEQLLGGMGMAIAIAPLLLTIRRGGSIGEGGRSWTRCIVIGAVTGLCIGPMMHLMWDWIMTWTYPRPRPFPPQAAV